MTDKSVETLIRLFKKLADPKHAEQEAQKMVDSICVMQYAWPMPEEGWKQFVADIEHTNKKRGWNLEIKIHED